MALLFTIVLPVIFTVFLGLLIPSGDEGEQGLPLAIADADGSPAAEQLVERLEASPLLELEAMTASEIDAAVQDQEVAAGLIIPEGYGAAAAAGQSVALTFVRVETSSGAQSVWQAVESVLSESNSSRAAATAAAEQVAAATGRPLDDDLLESAGSMVETQLAVPSHQGDHKGQRWRRRRGGRRVQSVLDRLPGQLGPVRSAGSEQHRRAGETTRPASAA